MKKILIKSFFVLMMFTIPGSLFAQSDKFIQKFSIGLSIVDANPGVNTRFYFLSKQSVEATVGSVEGGTFFNVAYLYDFYEIPGKPDIGFYGGGGFISTVVSADGGIFGSKTYSATGLWLPLGISVTIDQFQAFAEIDFVVYTGAYSGSDATWTLGGRYYF